MLADARLAPGWPLAPGPGPLPRRLDAIVVSGNGFDAVKA